MNVTHATAWPLALHLVRHVDEVCTAVTLAACRRAVQASMARYDSSSGVSVALIDYCFPPGAGIAQQLDALTAFAGAPQSQPSRRPVGNLTHARPAAAHGRGQLVCRAWALLALPAFQEALASARTLLVLSRAGQQLTDMMRTLPWTVTESSHELGRAARPANAGSTSGTTLAVRTLATTAVAEDAVESKRDAAAAALMQALSAMRSGIHLCQAASQMGPDATAGSEPANAPAEASRSCSGVLQEARTSAAESAAGSPPPARRHTRAVVMIGPMGSGKSSAAMALAQACTCQSSASRDGARPGLWDTGFYADLRSCCTGEQAFDALCSAFGIVADGAEPGQHAAAAWLAWLKGIRVGVVLDNVDALPRPAVKIVARALLQASPRVQLVITARDPVLRPSRVVQVLMVPPLSRVRARPARQPQRWRPSQRKAACMVMLRRAPERERRCP